VTTEIEIRRPAPATPNLPARMRYAQALADSGLLPAAYRRNPPNVLWAMEYGDMLGLSPMAAITGVHVIEGKPTASAGLISALVRRAGHKLRVRGDGKSATCEIIRADDPDYTFSVTWTLRKNGDGHPSAEEAGLGNKGTWKSYPASMLKSRAITQCARDACEEALYGLHYTPEELGAEVDAEGNLVGEIVDEAPAPAPQPAQSSDPIEDIWVTPEGGEDWVDKSTEQAAALASKDAGRVLYAQVVAKHEAGEITRDQRNDLCNLITAQMEHLAEGLEGTVAAPDGDPWQAEIDAMTTREDAIPLMDKLETAHKGGLVDGRRNTALRAAIRAKADGLPSAPGENAA
jgi:hypothetical protein